MTGISSGAAKSSPAVDAGLITTVAAKAAAMTNKIERAKAHVLKLRRASIPARLFCLKILSFFLNFFFISDKIF
jgi:hypothetical protein